MSFILDALKKSDHRRQPGSVPDLLTVHEPLPQEPKNRSVWLYLLVVALLLNAGILLAWLRPWQLEEPNVTTQSTVKQQHESTAIESGRAVFDAHLPVPAPPLSLAKTTNPEVKATEEDSLPKSDKTASTLAVKPNNGVPKNQPVEAGADVQRKVESEPAPTVDVRGSLEISPDVEEQIPVLNLSPAESLPSADIGVGSEQRILNLNELPLSVQQDLPDISISGHIYSNKPTLRIVNINGQILREGESVTEGLKLEEITQAGVIFSYQGYRFHIRGF